MDVKDRISIIEWLIIQSANNNFRQCTIHQAILVIDKYLSVTTEPIENMKEIALMSLFLAAKIEEVEIIGLDIISDGVFTGESKLDKLRQTEMNILEKLNYKIVNDTIYQYINAYHMSQQNESANYILSCSLAMMLLTTPEYQYIRLDILAEKIIDFTNLLETNETIIETIINTNVLYSYIYLTWEKYISSGCMAINHYFMKIKKYNIFSISIPQITCIYQFDTLPFEDYLIQKSSDIFFFTYPKKLFDDRNEIKKIGAGTFGSVKIVEINNKCIALKKIKCDEDDMYDGFNYYMIRELNILFKLQHENIANIDGFYYNKDKMILYIGMDLMDTTICTKIQKNDISEYLKFSYIQQFLTGIEYIHSQNVMHRDLSINNVLVSNDGRIKICDFGISRYFRHSEFHSRFTNLVCTLNYRSIELLLGEQVYTYKMDIWSCACIIYFILMKTELFRGDSELGMIYQILKMIGSPSPDSHSHIINLPHFCKEYSTFTGSGIIDLDKKYPKQASILYKMLIYGEENRINAREALDMFTASFN